MKDDQIYDYMTASESGSPHEKISRRAKEHEQYVNEFSVKAIFDAFYSSNVKSVRFLVSKADLLQRLVSEGKISELPSDSSFDNIAQYAKSFFATTFDCIEKTCSEKKIDFEWELISLTDRNKVSQLLINLYQKR